MWQKVAKFKGACCWSPAVGAFDFQSETLKKSLTLRSFGVNVSPREVSVITAKEFLSHFNGLILSSSVLDGTIFRI